MLASVLCRQLMVCARLPGAALWTHPGYHQVRAAVGTVAWTATIMPFGTPTKNKLGGAAAASAANKRGTVSPEGRVQKLIEKFDGHRVEHMKRMYPPQCLAGHCIDGLL